ncbi:HEPN domain-containing protein [Acetatifactor muris]|jgi:HEPN domain-containing protein|uniref:HEPN domain protein n=1 Tax=Acetatifactor muris TaxID=879566 RepID=A0A2K4ZMT7_9FIRM|nr:HEPN domain-containing protein [Acetatifactor muris]MCR2050096.1 HEPN domain-containing protein [Acetatifactor muris]SOY31755.1 HEPN domain protein [Acetatifactor muris]
MCDIRFFRRAYLDYRAAVNLWNVPENDEAYMNAVAYHLQQAVEKTLKAFLECIGETVPNTHDIDKLVRMSKNNGSQVFLTEWIEEKADMLTRWETDTRYDVDYCVERAKVQIGILEVKRFLEINGLKEDLREELKSDEVRSKLLSFFPKKYRPENDFEWNCLYQIYHRKLASDGEII